VFLAALLVMVGMAHRSQPILRVALGLLVFAALVAVPVYQAPPAPLDSDD